MGMIANERGGAAAVVLMLPPGEPPQLIQFRDGSTLRPNAKPGEPIAIPANFVNDFLRANWRRA